MAADKYSYGVGVDSFALNGSGRIGLDSCYASQYDIQNVSACNYMTQNYFGSDCSMRRPIDLATQQPGVNYSGGYNVGAGGCNIDQNSQLMIGSINTANKCRINLFHRPFGTVPYMGRGTVDSVVESQMMQGELQQNKKSVFSLPSTLGLQQTPLLNVVRDNRLNTVFEADVLDGWTRGGVDSRDAYRDVKMM
jgi:hypothetical protein